MILPSIEHLKGGRKAIALLIDPDKASSPGLRSQIQRAEKMSVDLIFVGGSLISNHIDDLVTQIKSLVSIPVVLFPGSPLQLSSKVDAVLLLSLISGRNPDYLIGNHVIAAPFLRESKVEVIPTGYILIHGGCQTSVAYMSNTQPIPANKTDIALATAMAGEMLGLKLIYLDAGSGADNPVSRVLIEAIARTVHLPILVGGGIRTPSDIRTAFVAGADLVVVGTVAESNWKAFEMLVEERDRFNT